MIRMAQSGENGLLWNALAVAGGVVSARRRDDYVRAVETVLVTLVLNTAVKHAVRRARPVLEAELPALTPVLSGRSYPSARRCTPSRSPWPCRARISACTTRPTWWRAPFWATPWRGS